MFKIDTECFSKLRPAVSFSSFKTQCATRTVVWDWHAFPSVSKLKLKDVFFRFRSVKDVKWTIMRMYVNYELKHGTKRWLIVFSFSWHTQSIYGIGQEQSISPTLHEQLFCINFLLPSNKNTNLKYKKAAC